MKTNVFPSRGQKCSIWINVPLYLCYTPSYHYHVGLPCLIFCLIQGSSSLTSVKIPGDPFFDGCRLPFIPQLRPHPWPQEVIPSTIQWSLPAPAWHTRGPPESPLGKHQGRGGKIFRMRQLIQTAPYDDCWTDVQMLEAEWITSTWQASLPPPSAPAHRIVMARSRNFCFCFGNELLIISWTYLHLAWSTKPRWTSLRTAGMCPPSKQKKIFSRKISYRWLVKHLLHSILYRSIQTPWTFSRFVT